MRDRKIKKIINELRDMAHSMVTTKRLGCAERISIAAEFIARAANADRNERQRRKNLGRAYFSVKKAAAAEVKETDEEQFTRQM